MNPTQAFANRTARLVTEAATPIYTTETGKLSRFENEMCARAEEFAGPDFCHICGRCTDHYGEHSDAQLLAWAKSPQGQFLIG